MSALDRVLTRAAYVARQGPRLAWYLGHGQATRLIQRRQADAGDGPSEANATSLPASGAILDALARLLRTDLENVERGVYPMPGGVDGTLADMLGRSRAYFADLAAIHERRKAGGHQQAAEIEGFESLPRYFRQNFHYQSDGYLSEGSARIYDTQVEVLFAGAANAMRRQVLVPVADHIRGRDQRHLSLADIACGTGALLNFARQAWPRLRLAGVDLSLPYLEEARRRNRARRHIGYATANAEALPFADASLDIVTDVFLFHELPPKVRRIVAGEIARVLKPGGLLVHMDSLQLGDVVSLDRALEIFPASFHEPYYAGYIREDLDALFGGAGLRPVAHDPVFVSKRSVYVKA